MKSMLFVLPAVAFMIMATGCATPAPPVTATGVNKLNHDVGLDVRNSRAAWNAEKQALDQRVREDRARAQRLAAWDLRLRAFEAVLYHRQQVRPRPGALRDLPKQGPGLRKLPPPGDKQNPHRKHPPVKPASVGESPQPETGCPDKPDDA